ncbi:hypothetical protein [Streptomyces guryensis]|uniref:Uncharacterized protein n=1 Tax=Streptomyces guryensis TaxID=2886947 RepID=A0A9Q3ZET0_9ACTN|nr:hypothetical protein [Streptomyces guryensis]MCD9879750.1 hypothetical protein [Streptomyces guryensis]
MRLKKPGRGRPAVLIPALALLLIPFSAGTASANTSPGWGDDKPDVIADCNAGKPDLCQYHQVNAWTARGKRHQATNVVSNCASTRDLTDTLTASYTTGTSYSYEQSRSLEISAGFASNGISSGITASNSSTETWGVNSTNTITQTFTATIPAGMKGAYWFQPYVRHSQGWIEVHYHKKQHGHWIWYYNGKDTGHVHIDTPVLWKDGALRGQIKGEWFWATWKC